MREREPRRRRKEIAAWSMIVAGSVAMASTLFTAADPEKVKEESKDIPLSMGAILQATDEAGIPTTATLASLSGISFAGIAFGVSRIRRLRS